MPEVPHLFQLRSRHRTKNLQNLPAHPPPDYNHDRIWIRISSLGLVNLRFRGKISDCYCFQSLFFHDLSYTSGLYPDQSDPVATPLEGESQGSQTGKGSGLLLSMSIWTAVFLTLEICVLPYFLFIFFRSTGFLQKGKFQKPLNLTISQMPST